MSDRKLNLDALQIDESGRVVLSDDMLIEIERDWKLPAGANNELVTTQNYIFCDKDQTNTYNCSDQANTSCENDWMCQGSSNLQECSNAVNCTGQGGQNLITCTNATTSGCSP